MTVQPVLFLSSLRTPSQSVLGELLQKNSSRGQQGMSVSEPQLGSAAWRCGSVDCEKRLQSYAEGRCNSKADSVQKSLQSDQQAKTTA